MKKLNLFIGYIVLITILLFSFNTCGDSSSGDPIGPGGKTVTGISVTGIKTVYEYGETIDLSAVTVTITYSDGTSETIAA